MRILFAAGGTGGHVFPALSLAEAFLREDPGATIAFVGTAKGMETTLVPKAGHELFCLKVEGVKGKGAWQRIKSLCMIPAALFEASRILSRFKPDCVIGIGGYASGPVLFLASVNGIRTGILEPNAVPGFSNRVLAKFVRRVYVAFPVARLWFPVDKTLVTGNPIRPGILSIPPPDFQGKKLRVLVFGGSQGAHRINLAVCGMFGLMGTATREFSFTHQTGRSDLDEVRAAYQKAGIDADVREFIDDMDRAYAGADVVIARSGSSVLEIAACGRPSILIPYPYAADDHQMANARVLEQKGASVVIADRELTAENLWKSLREIREPGRLAAMSRAALELRAADASAKIVQDMSTQGGHLAVA